MRKILYSWQIWATGATLVAVGVSFTALTWLGSPGAGGCQGIRRSDSADAGLRFYCAQLAAAEGDVTGLMEAIETITAIPSESPLRPEATRLIRIWSQEVLNRAEDTFQQGSLEEAISIVRRLPAGARSEMAVNKRIDRWQEIWATGEDLQQQIEGELDLRQWQQAFLTARSLLTLDNQYWAKTRYEELVSQIREAKEEQDSQNPRRDRSRMVANRRTPNTKDLVAQWQKEQEAEALAQLRKARQLASRGNVAGLQDALNAAEEVLYGTPQYDEAQSLVKQWRRDLEVLEDRPYLDRAQQLAGKGDSFSLQAAISEASQVGYGRALYDEAQSRIEQWSDQVRQLRSSPSAELNPTLPAPPNPGVPPVPDPVIQPASNSTI